MIYNTEAVVIRSTSYADNDVIVTLLTPDGIVAAMARGAKKPQSRLVAAIPLCVQAVYSLYQRRGMAIIRQCEIIDARRGLRTSLEATAYASYFCDLIRSVAEERPHGTPRVYREFCAALDRLQAGAERTSLTARIFEAKTLRALGAAPDWCTCVRCDQAVQGSVYYSAAEGGIVCSGCGDCAFAAGAGRTLLRLAAATPRILQQMTTVPWARLGEIRLTAATEHGVNQVLRMQMEEFAGLSLKSRAVLESLNLF